MSSEAHNSELMFVYGVHRGRSALKDMAPDINNRNVWVSILDKVVAFCVDTGQVFFETPVRYSMRQVLATKQHYVCTCMDHPWLYVLNLRGDVVELLQLYYIELFEPNDMFTGMRRWKSELNRIVLFSCDFPHLVLVTLPTKDQGRCKVEVIQRTLGGVESVVFVYGRAFVVTTTQELIEIGESKPYQETVVNEFPGMTNVNVYSVQPGHDMLMVGSNDGLLKVYCPHDVNSCYLYSGACTRKVSGERVKVEKEKEEREEDDEQSEESVESDALYGMSMILSVRGSVAADCTSIALCHRHWLSLVCTSTHCLVVGPDKADAKSKKALQYFRIKRNYYRADISINHKLLICARRFSSKIDVFQVRTL